MEDKIEVGEFVRTLNGNISKVLSIRKKSSFRTNTGHISTSPERYFVDNLKQYSISKPYVKKHSKNIIELIEVGDFIEILADEEPFRFEVDSIDYKHKLKNIAANIKVKSIVTHEQINQMKYIVEE